MKDYYQVQPDQIALLGKHFTKGRSGQRIRYITRHHTAGVLDAAGINRVWRDRPASAHYLVDPAGKSSQHVWDADTAWANNNAFSNSQTIAIEHSNSAGPSQGWPINEVTIRNGARLAAALCLFYKLGRPVFGKNIRDHREFSSTSCPHHLAQGGKYHVAWMDEACRFYDLLAAGAVHPDGTPKTNHPVKKENNMELFGPDQVGALHEAKVSSAAAETNTARLLGHMEERRPSLINPDQAFSLPDYIRLVDAAVWESRRLMEAIALKVGLDPDEVIADAIEKDRQK